MRRVILAIVSTAIGLVFLLSFKTHTQSALGIPAAALGTPAPGSGAGSAGTSAGPAASSAKKTSAKKASAKSGSAGAGASTTVTGQAVDTFYGPVQVKITVKGGKITAVTATEYPMNSPRDYQINSYAIPALNQEALQASSANIDSISGATYTSQGYIGSLQSAVDQARL